MFSLVHYFSASLRCLKQQRLLLLVLTASLIYGCGFHLRGALDISPDLSPIYLQQNSAPELAREIKRLLASNNLLVIEAVAEKSPDQLSNDKAATRLIILNEAKKQRVLSVDNSGRAREYALTYSVNFAIKIRQEKETSESVSVTRSLLFDVDAVLAVENESAVLYKDMRRDAARLILLKLQARARNTTSNNVDGGEGNSGQSPPQPTENSSIENISPE